MDEGFVQPSLGKIEVENTENYNIYECSICHTSFYSSHSPLTTCIFCGGHSLFQIESENFDDYSYLPFEVPLRDVYDFYKDGIRHNFLLPFSFRGKKIMKKIQKAYIPCFLYSMTVEGNITFYGADKIRSVKAAPKQVFECMYSTHFDYANLLISNYARINNVAISNINDYDFSNLTKIDSDMTRDSSFIVGDYEKNDITEKVQDKVLKQCMNIVRGNVGHDLKKLADNQLSLGISSYNSVFVPVYFINFRYKGHEYLFLVNGQTGKMIIDVPSSMGNLVLLSILCFVFFILIGILVVHFI